MCCWQAATTITRTSANICTSIALAVAGYKAGRYFAGAAGTNSEHPLRKAEQRRCPYGKYVSNYIMSPKTRFQVMLEPPQIAWLRLIQQKTGATLGEQIRRAVSLWIQSEVGIDSQVVEMPLNDLRAAVVKKAKRKRTTTRKRSKRVNR